MLNKDTLRLRIKKLREELSEETIEVESLKLWEKIFSTEEFKKAKSVMSYVNFGKELNTKFLNKKILENGKILLLPRIEREKLVPVKYSGKLKKGVFGILEPLGEIYEGEIDLIIMPGLAFDRNGNRLGYGGAYYDIFLKDNAYSKKIAPILDFQLVEEVPSEKHDIKVDIIILKNERIVTKSIEKT